MNKLFDWNYKCFIYVIYIVIACLFITAIPFYQGQKLIYILFSVAFNGYLYIGFGKKAIFFELILAVFFWLGFWLKTTIRMIFENSHFFEAVGNFNGSGVAFDQALLASSVGVLGFILASLVRRRYVFNYLVEDYEKKETQQGILAFYRRHRTFTLFSFVCIYLIVGISNIYLGIYQRGAIPETVLPFGLNGIYKWLLLFGLASISAVIINSELAEKKQISWGVIMIVLVETIVSNISLLSRGMILSVAALTYGYYKACKCALLKISALNVVLFVIIFSVLFLTTVYSVNYLRAGLSSRIQLIEIWEKDEYKEAVNDVKIANDSAAGTPLFLDRWVGIEGVMAATSSQDKGWGLWKKAWEEKFSNDKISFYDKNIILSPYRDTDFNLHHYVSLPGVIGFFLYPNSLLFLFFSMFLISLFASSIEYMTYKYCGNNLILCSLIAEVMAFRFVHFGYAPGQTYLLFFAIIGNLLLINILNKIATQWYKNKKVILQK